MGRVKNDWHVYLHPDFCREADMLSDGAFRLHITALGWSAQWQGRSHLPLKMARRLVPDFKDSQTVELVALGWWISQADGFQIGESEFWKVTRNREARKSIPKSIRVQVYARDGYVCVECGCVDDLTLDHIHPYSLGGLDTVENLRTLCRPCNSSKGARV